MRGVHPLHRRLPPEVIANEVPREIIANSREDPIFIRASTGTTRRTVPKIKADDAMPTSEANMMLIKVVDATSKADMAHVREAFELQTAVLVMVDNAVSTKKWSSLEVTSVTTSTPTQI
jgi:hypothetical protein